MSTTTNTPPLTAEVPVEDLKANGMTIANIKAVLDEQEIPAEAQVDDLIAEGFSLAEIVAAGYTKSDIKAAGFTSLEYSDAKTDASTAAAAAASAANKSGTDGTVIIIVAIALVVVVVLVAVVAVNRKSSNGGSDEPPTAFENPMYAATSQGAGRPNPLFAAGPTAGSGYMDVNPGQAAPATSRLTSGYMDVTPQYDNQGQDMSDQSDEDV
jgi:hypothetical protein